MELHVAAKGVSGGREDQRPEQGLDTGPSEQTEKEEAVQ